MLGWFAAVTAFAADLRPVQTFGDIRFAHTAQVLAVSPADDGRVRTLAGRSVWTWPADGTRSGEAPLAGCPRALRGVFSDDGQRIAVECADGGSGLFTVAGKRLASVTLDLSRPASYCGPALWLARPDAGLDRIDDSGNSTAVDLRGTVVSTACADGIPVAAIRNAVVAFDPRSGAASPPIAAKPHLLGPATSPPGHASGDEPRVAAVVDGQGGLQLATVNVETGELAFGPLLTDGPEPYAVALGVGAVWAVARGHAVEVFGPEGPRWTLGPPVDGLATHGGFVPGDEVVWIARGLRIDRFGWGDGRSPTASVGNIAAPPDPDRRALWFGADGALYARTDHVLAALDIADGHAATVAAFSPGAGRPTALSDGRFAAPVGDRVEVVGGAGNAWLRGRGGAIDADGQGWACAAARGKGIAVIRADGGPADAGAQASAVMSVWDRVKDGAKANRRVRLPGVPRFVRWEPDGAGVWLGYADQLLRVAGSSGGVQRYAFEWERVWDVAFDDRGAARVLVAVEAERRRPDGTTAVNLGATPTLEVRTPSGRTIGAHPLPWTGVRAYGFVPGTLEVWQLGADGALTLFDPEVGAETAVGTLPIRPLGDGEPPLAWSQDGATVAAEAADGRISVWAR